VLVKSFARIHLQNLINFGILPLIFCEENDYENIQAGDKLEIQDLLKDIESNNIKVINITRNQEYKVKHSLSERQLEIIKVGGLLNYVGSSK
jgi:aconitate hydratase